MLTYKETPLSCGLSLKDDGIEEYGDLIKDKDALIRFLTCMVENDRLEVISENNIQEFLSNVNEHWLANSKKFDAEEDYGVSALGQL